MKDGVTDDADVDVLLHLMEDDGLPRAAGCHDKSMSNKQVRAQKLGPRHACQTHSAVHRYTWAVLKLDCMCLVPNFARMPDVSCSIFSGVASKHIRFAFSFSVLSPFSLRSPAKTCCDCRGG